MDKRTVVNDDVDRVAEKVPCVRLEAEVGLLEVTNKWLKTALPALFPDAVRFASLTDTVESSIEILGTNQNGDLARS